MMGTGWVEEGKEVETVEEVEETECERDNPDSLGKDGDIKEEEKKRDRELTRIVCLCFSGVSVNISS